MLRYFTVLSGGSISQSSGGFLLIAFLIENNPCGFVPFDALGGLITPQYVSSHFQVILKENGLRKIRFHDLRHSCASLLLANNIHMKMIQDCLGHSDMVTTANIYSHIDSTSKLASASAIEEVLGTAEEVENPE